MVVVCSQFVCIHGCMYMCSVCIHGCVYVCSLCVHGCMYVCSLCVHGCVYLCSVCTWMCVCVLCVCVLCVCPFAHKCMYVGLVACTPTSPISGHVSPWSVLLSLIHSFVHSFIYSFLLFFPSLTYLIYSLGLPCSSKPL